MEPLIACVDVDYRQGSAVAAALWFRGWPAPDREKEAVAVIQPIEEYEPGEFYKRELPCLLKVLECGPKPDITIVDGYVWLGAGKPGLGAHLASAVGGVVVGVAKSCYESAKDAIAVLRGASRNPLYVTSEGIPVAEAAANVVTMHGPYRIPTLLRQVDVLARSHSSH